MAANIISIMYYKVFNYMYIVSFFLTASHLNSHYFSVPILIASDAFYIYYFRLCIVLFFFYYYSHSDADWFNHTRFFFRVCYNVLMKANGMYLL